MSGEAPLSHSNSTETLGMPIILARERPFRIGDAEFRPATREVLFGDRTAVIEPRVMQFLIALHRADGAVVSKDDLLQSCWDGRVVGDDAINRVVSRLRGTAEKEAGRQFRIETITKVGYRLLSAQGVSPNPVAVAAQPFSGAAAATDPVAQVATGRAVFPLTRATLIAVGGLLLLLAIAGAWLWFRPAPAAGHEMMVRLAGFRALTADVPTTMPESINAEITAAFNVDGVIGVSNATPSSGATPSYAVDGTIYRVGGSIRVITRFTNERSGVALWSDSVDYPADQIAKVPHKIAVDVGTVVRCGLSGAATYRKALPDPVLSNYMHYCQEYWAYSGSKTLRYAQLVVGAVPDFSWGWSAVANGYVQMANLERDSGRADSFRALGREAEDRALALDSANSEALAHKSYLIDKRDWIGQEKLLKNAIAAQPLDCGCEHYGYGLKLEALGRTGAAIEEFRAATDMLALWPDSQMALARTLVAVGRGEEAKPYFQAMIDLSKDPNADKKVTINSGTETGDYAAAMAALRNPQYKMPETSRAALLSGYEALASGDAAAKAQAVKALLAVPEDERRDVMALMLGALGANREALEMGADAPWIFWRRSMRGALYEPAFPSVAQRLGLMTYWKTTRSKPDICQKEGAPPFCQLI